MSEPNPFDRGKILRFFDEVRHCSETGELFYPRMATIYPSAICNYRCPGCLCDSVNNGNAQVKLLDVDKFLPVMYDMRELGVRAVEFAGGGEPTLHPEFTKLALATRAMDVRLGILTNGSMVGQWDDSLIQAFSYIRVSLNGWDEESFIKMHGTGSTYLHVLESIKRLVHKCMSLNTAGQAPPVVGLKSLVSQDNWHNLVDLCEQAKRLGVEYIQFKGLRNHPNELTELEIRGTKKLLQWIDAKGIVAPTRVHDSLVIPSECKMSAWDDKIGCMTSMMYTTIDAAGDVWLCCYFSHRKDSIKIGNIFEKSFKDIWMGDEHRRVLQEVNLSECDSYDCRFQLYQKILKEAIVTNRVHVDFI